MAAQSFEDAEALIAQGHVQTAIELTVRAAQGGDARAIHQLAVWRLIGHPLPRDLRAARSLLRGAAAGGHADARLMEIALMANGSGGPADWPAALTLLRETAAGDDLARQHLALVNAMDLDDDGAPKAFPQAELLSERCSIKRHRRLLSPEECRHIAITATELLEPAAVVDPDTGRQIRHPVRTSDGAVIGPTREDLVVRALNRRIAAISATDIAQGEALAVLRYAPGQQYRPHLDTIAGAANQRIRTVLIYLNEGYGGGETVFPDLGVTVTPAGGDAVVFDNILPDGRPDPASRHAGLPVTQGVKWLATRWIRAEPIDPWTMPAN